MTDIRKAKLEWLLSNVNQIYYTITDLQHRVEMLEGKLRRRSRRTRKGHGKVASR